MKKIISLVMAMMMIVATTQSVSAEVQFNDISGHWAENEVAKWLDNGFVNGYGDGTFMPNESITRAEFYTLLNNVVDLADLEAKSFVDLEKDKWYYETLSKANAAGIADGPGNGMMKPNDEIMRSEVAVVISKLMNYAEPESYVNLNAFADKAMVASWSKDALESLLVRGILKGNPDNTIKASMNITRAEAVVVLDRLFGSVYNSKGTFGSDDEAAMETVSGNVTITTGDVTLKNMTIKGDLYIAEGVADGEVYLDNVIIAGDTIVKGGGENSIYFNNVTVGGALVVNKVGNKLRIVASGKTEVKVTVLESGAILIEKELLGGGFQTVEVSKDMLEGAEIVLSGQFKEVNVDAPGVEIDVAENAKVDKINVNENAKGVSITGKGKVDAVKVDADNVSVGTADTEVEIGDNVEGTKVGEEDTTTGDTTSGGTSSGGSSGDNDTDDNDDSDDDGSNKLELSKEELTLEFEATHQLQAEVETTTTSAITWLVTTSGALDLDFTTVDPSTLEVDESIVTVSDTGLITAKSTSGAAIVVAYLADDMTVGDTCEVTVVAEIGLVTYTVDFDTADDLISVLDQEVEEGELAARPYLEKYGFRFNGWYLDGEYFDFDTPITSDITLVAQWEAKTTDIDIEFMDTRFASGYPNITINSDNEIDIAIKVKEASVANPAKVYMIVNQSNPSWIADSEAVMHGHTGEDQFIWASSYHYLEISDTEEHILNTYEHFYTNDLMVSAFVIEQGGVISEFPTVLHHNEQIVAELDTYSPYPDVTYVNEARDEVSIFFDNIDKDSVPEVEDFSFVVAGDWNDEDNWAVRNDITVTNVEIIDTDENWYSDYEVKLSIDGLTNSDDITTLRVKYDGTAIRDNAVVPNLTNEFYEEILLETLAVYEVSYSESKQYVYCKVETGSYDFDMTLRYGSTYASSVEVDAQRRGGYYSSDSFNRKWFVETPPTGAGQYYVDVTATNFLGREYTINSKDVTVEIIEAVTIDSIDVDVDSNEIVVNISDELGENVHACNFTVAVNGTEHVLAGHGWADYDGTNYFISFDSENIYFEMNDGDTIKVKYDPKHLEKDDEDGMQSLAGEPVVITGEWMDVNFID